MRRLQPCHDLSGSAILKSDRLIHATILRAPPSKAARAVGHVGHIKLGARLPQRLWRRQK